MDPLRHRPSNASGTDPSLLEDSRYDALIALTSLQEDPLFSARVTRLLKERRILQRRALLSKLRRLRHSIAQTLSLEDGSVSDSSGPSNLRSSHALRSRDRDTSSAPNFRFSGHNLARRSQPILAATPVTIASELSSPCDVSQPASSYEVDDAKAESNLRQRPVASSHTSSLPPESALQMSPEPALRVSSPHPSTASSFHLMSDVLSLSHFVSNFSEAYAPPLQKNPPSCNYLISTSETSPKRRNDSDVVLSEHPVPFCIARAPRDEHVAIAARRLSQPLQNRSTSQNAGPSLQPSVLSHRHPNYVPPLMATLFFQQELHSLFDDNHHLTTASRSDSISHAEGLYNQRLYPNPATENFTLTEEVTSVAQESTAQTLDFAPSPQTVLAQDRSVISQGVSHILTPFASRLFPDPAVSNATGISHNDFQRRTYFRRMEGADERRAPTAAWRSDSSPTAGSQNNQVQTSSYASYRVSSNNRNHSSYLSAQGVHSSPHLTTVALNFGFQRQTNYPFRKTYANTAHQHPQLPTILMGNEEQSLSPALRNVSIRVPLQGLTAPFVQLLASWKGSGNFFPASGNSGSTGSIIRRDSEPDSETYSIGKDGKLYFAMEP